MLFNCQVVPQDVLLRRNANTTFAVDIDTTAADLTKASNGI